MTYIQNWESRVRRVFQRKPGNLKKIRKYKICSSLNDDLQVLHWSFAQTWEILTLSPRSYFSTQLFQNSINHSYRYKSCIVYFFFKFRHKLCCTKSGLVEVPPPFAKENVFLIMFDYSLILSLLMYTF